MTAPNRCEPPEGLRGVDGWHWVEIDGTAQASKWEIGKRRGSWRTLGATELWYSDAKEAAQCGARYLSPVPSPSDLARLVEAARGMRDHMHDQITSIPAATFPVENALIERVDDALAPFSETAP